VYVTHYCTVRWRTDQILKASTACLQRRVEKVGHSEQASHMNESRGSHSRLRRMKPQPQHSRWQSEQIAVPQSEHFVTAGFPQHTYVAASGYELDLIELVHGLPRFCRPLQFSEQFSYSAARPLVVWTLSRSGLNLLKKSCLPSQQSCQPLCLVAGEAVVLGSTLSAGDYVPQADTHACINRRVGGTRVGAVTSSSESHHAAAAGGDAKLGAGRSSPFDQRIGVDGYAAL
jgi:hypothetical protein